MYQKTRPTVTYPAKPWQQRQSVQQSLSRREHASLPVGSYGGGRPPNATYRRKVYMAIIDYAADHGGNTPTRRELCDLCEISSTSVVTYHILALVDDGLLEWRDRKLIITGGTWTPPAGAMNK